ncbi:MAG: hypothetical protein KBT27_13240 [Prevotellaceae bacterium]|nr:hypothetical protein [Candidatus Faecinaster equi]
MAQFEMELPDDFVKFMSENLADIDRYAPEMLKAGGAIIENAIKNNMPSDISSYAVNVKPSKPKKTKNDGWVLPINFTGKTKHTGIPVMTLAAFYEYGTHNNKVPKTAFLRNAINGAANEAAEAMMEVFQKEVSK